MCHDFKSREHFYKGEKIGMNSLFSDGKTEAQKVHVKLL